VCGVQDEYNNASGSSVNGKVHLEVINSCHVDEVPVLVGNTTRLQLALLHGRVTVQVRQRYVQLGLSMFTRWRHHVWLSVSTWLCRAVRTNCLINIISSLTASFRCVPGSSGSTWFVFLHLFCKRTLGCSASEPWDQWHGFFTI